ncbi:tetratricopeptide repeat protein [Bacillus sp. NP157]|nr:tetratricopeptide repeat protein [Bacillus sp. NP157]
MQYSTIVRAAFACAALALAGCAAQPAKPKDTQADPDLVEVLKGVKMIEAGQIQAAIDGPLTDVVSRYETKYGHSDKRMYSARGFTQTLIYLGGAAKDIGDGTDKRSAVALGPAWGMAYWARGYAYAEMARYPEAEAELKKALALSPNDAQFQGELAYVYQTEHRTQESLALYTSMVDNVPLMDDWPDAMKNEFTCKAWRGQGYDLAELGRFDDAEKAYRECLKVIPNEPKSEAELGWIATQKARPGHKP